ncbi:MAG: hypothetical protein MI861_01335, partial [Pirellulales bacterium]|nr:hypothetical protein [Pirellulales bacterium]
VERRALIWHHPFPGTRFPATVIHCGSLCLAKRPGGGGKVGVDAAQRWRRSVNPCQPENHRSS